MESNLENSHPTFNFIFTKVYLSKDLVMLTFENPRGAAQNIEILKRYQR